MKIKALIKKVAAAGFLNSLVLALVAMSANSACCWVFHQPEFPETANRLKKH